jgi:hypothetical protein
MYYLVHRGKQKDGRKAIEYQTRSKQNIKQDKCRIFERMQNTTRKEDGKIVFKTSK